MSVDDFRARTTQSNRSQGILTRDALQDGSFLRAVRALSNNSVLSDADIERSLSKTLAERPKADRIWVFGYGSLMWNPAFEFDDQRPAGLPGWHRQFCLWMRIGRGSVERPGLTLGLGRGGKTHGVAFRLGQQEEWTELLMVWRREMFADAYLARWVTLETIEGPVEAIAFVANPESQSFAGDLPYDRVIECIATAEGPLGSCADYLQETVDRLASFGIHDRNLEGIRRSVAHHIEARVQNR